VCGSSTTRCRVAGGVLSAVAAGCSALRACPTATGVTPRVVTMSGMDTPPITRNKTISRSGSDSVEISARILEQRSASTRRWLCSRDSMEVIGAGAPGGELGGGATKAPPRAAAPPGPAAVVLPRTPTPGSGCRPLEPTRPQPTGIRVDHPTSARHTPGGLGDIAGTPVRRAILTRRDGREMYMNTPERLVLGTNSRALRTPKSGACAPDTNPEASM
jgi:hypothetical protein